MADPPTPPTPLTPSGRTLVLMRHAKAESSPSGPIGGDIGRRLTERGRDDAAAAGRWLAEIGCVPDHALVSAAERTQETWAAVAETSGSTADVDVSRAMYGALGRLDPGEPPARPRLGARW